MNFALIFAGGTGERFGNSIPKQFLKYNGKSIFIHTIDVFEKNENISGIVLVMRKGWEREAEKEIKRNKIEKVRKIVLGSQTAFSSIFNGLKAAASLYDKSDIVLLHDGVRPLLDQDTINNNISTCKSQGNAITAIGATETVMVRENEITILQRDSCFLARAPQTFFFGEILSLYENAKKEDKEFIDSASLASHYGVKLNIVKGREENIKITSPIDFYLFKAYINALENEALYGREGM